MTEQQISIEYIAAILKASQELVAKEQEQWAKKLFKKTRHTNAMNKTDEYEVWIERAKRAIKAVGGEFGEIKGNTP